MSTHINQFNTKNNHTMLWEILIERINVGNNTTPTEISNIRSIFDSNIKMINTTKKYQEKTLLTLNKEFLSKTIESIHGLLPWTNNSSKIKITNIDASDDIIYTAEEFKHNKQIQFSDEYNKRQNDFNETAHPEIPKSIDFSLDTNEDKKITNIEELLSETISRRNYDVPDIVEKVNVNIDVANTDVNTDVNTDINTDVNTDINIDADVLSFINTETTQRNHITEYIKQLRATSLNLNKIADEMERNIIA